MKETLKIHTENDYFFLETEYTIFPQLEIKNKKGSQLFTHIESSKWMISAKEVSSFLTPDKEDRMFINYGDTLQIDVTKFNIEFTSQSFILVDGNPLYLYVTLDNKLRFIWNQKPSAKAYHERSKILSINNDVDFFKCQLYVESKFSPLSTCQLVIKHRQFNTEIEISASSLNSQLLIENKNYGNIVNFSFNPELIFQQIHPHIQTKGYDTSLFDLFFKFDIVSSPLTDLPIRVGYSEDLPLEIWTQYSKNQMIMLAPYKTAVGNLSFRIGLIEKDVHSYYIKKSNELSLDNNDKPIIIIVEHPYKAQDNGFFFFKYLIENQNKYTPYYLITDDSPDLGRLSPYMNNVVFFKTKEHIQLLFNANYLCHTHTSNYALPFLSQKIVSQKMKLKKIFLQHGIMGIRNLSFVYNKSGQPDLTDILITSSNREKLQAQKQLNFTNDEIAVTGLARFDSLLKDNSTFKSLSLKKNIVIMPTWRKGLQNLSDEQFMQTEYFRCFNELINDASFKNLVDKRNLSVSFYLHTNFQKYHHLFSSPFVEVISETNDSVQNILKRNGIMITDYSSVGLDFSLQRRSVLYYQFENDTGEIFEGIENEKLFLPGPILKSRDSLLRALEKKTKVNILESKYRHRVKTKLYSFNDTKACQRIYNVLDKM